MERLRAAPGPWRGRAIVVAGLLLALVAVVAIATARRDDDASYAATEEWRLPEARWPEARPEAELAALRARVEAALRPIVAPHGERIGVLVAGAAPGETLFAHEADRSFVPASNVKLVTTALVWLLIGPDEVYETRLLRTGPIEDGTLRGDLIVEGAGDPNLSPRAHGGAAADPATELVVALKAAGVVRVDGDLILDDGLFPRDGPPPGWTEETRTHWYAAEVSALVLNDACVDIAARPGAKPGDPAIVTAVPEADGVEIVSEVTTVAKGTRSAIRFVRPVDGNRIVVAGRVEVGTAGESSPCAIHDPTRVFGGVTTRALREAGISLGGTVRVEPGAAARARGTVVATLRGTVGDAIVAANVRSQNLCAEALFRLLGARLEGEGSWEAGRRVAARALAEAGVDPESIRIVDGSGLSYDNAATPRALADWLRFVGATAAGEAFRASLPAGGDGTLRGRLRGAGIAERTRLKTGTLTGRSALSGWVETDAGPLAISILSHRLRDRRAVEDRIVVALIRATSR